MKKQNILIIGLILLAAISFIIFILVSGSGNKGNGNKGNVETPIDINDIINTINKNNKNVLPELETMKVDIKNIDEVTSYTGLKTNNDIESIVVSVPMMTSQAYSVAVVKVKDNADVEKIKQEMLDNIDMRRWICVSAEQLYITNSGKVIFSVMADKDTAKAVYNDFKKYVNNNIGKELEKSEYNFEEVGKLYEKYNSIKEVTREIINEFVKKIIVGKYDSETNSRDIKIEWRYQF